MWNGLTRPHCGAHRVAGRLEAACSLSGQMLYYSSMMVTLILLSGMAIL
jgi:hypothetical protein